MVRTVYNIGAERENDKHRQNVQKNVRLCNNLYKFNVFTEDEKEGEG